jgi:hypothetical protein
MVEAQVELCAMEEIARRRSHRLQEKKEARDIEAEVMVEANKPNSKKVTETLHPTQLNDEDILLEDTVLGGEYVNDPLTLGDDAEFKEAIRKGYTQDKFFEKLEANPEDFKGFTKGEDGI